MAEESLMRMLRELRLSGLATSLDVRLQEAKGHRLEYGEFLEMVLQDELMVRQERVVTRRVKQAEFRELRTIDNFDFSFNPSVPRKKIYDLAACGFIRQAKDVLLLGPPGVGKSHIAQAIGHEAIKSGFTVRYRSIFDVVRDFLQDEAFAGQDKVMNKYLKPDLLIIDDMGIKPLPRRSGEYFFEVIMRRYELKSTLMTSNRPLEEWGKLIGDVPAATAILDRFLHHADIINITGRSYRLRNRTEENRDAEKPEKEESPTPQPSCCSQATAALPEMSSTSR